MGQAYRENGEFNKAIEAIRESLSKTHQDSLKDERRIALSCLYLARADYDNAEFELLRVAHFSDYPAVKEKAFFFLAVRYIYSYDWSQAEEALRNARAWNDTGLGDRIQNAKQTGHKSDNLARWLSTFLPGTGQAYCGDWKNGLNAFALNGLLVYVMTDALLNLRYLDIIETYGYLRRYYMGNRDNSARIAKEYNSEINAAQSGKILETLYQGAMKKENQMDINMGHSEIRKTSP